MRVLRSVLLLGLFALPAAFAHSQVSVGVGIGGPAVVYGSDVYDEDAYGPPICQWGYYPYSPYSCAPDGYYGPSWFVSGLFIGAGPWYGWNGGYYGGGYYGGGYYRSNYYNPGYYGGGYYGHNDYDRDDGYGDKGLYGRNGNGGGYGNQSGYGRGYNHAPARAIPDHRGGYMQSPHSTRMPYVSNRGPMSGFEARGRNGGGYNGPRGSYGGGNVAPRSVYGGGGHASFGGGGGSHAFNGGGHPGGGFSGGGGGHSSGGGGGRSGGFSGGGGGGGHAGGGHR